MGADIYLESVYQENHDKYNDEFIRTAEKRDRLKSVGAPQADIDKVQKIVERLYDKMFEKGYFRDSYNGTSLFWVLGLSWWQDVGDNMLNKKGYMSVRRMKKLRQMVMDAKMITIDRAYLESQHVQVDNGENSPKAWKDYFEKKREDFIKFLDEAIEKKEYIRCSV
jgi:hypothetical protein